MNILKDNHGDLHFFWIIIIIFVCILLFVGSMLNFIAYPTAKKACYKFAEETNNEVKFVRYNIFNWSCMINFDDKWIPYERWINNTGN